MKRSLNKKWKIFTTPYCRYLVEGVYSGRPSFRRKVKIKQVKILVKKHRVGMEIEIPLTQYLLYHVDLRNRYKRILVNRYKNQQLT